VSREENFEKLMMRSFLIFGWIGRKETKEESGNNCTCVDWKIGAVTVCLSSLLSPEKESVKDKCPSSKFLYAPLVRGTHRNLYIHGSSDLLIVYDQSNEHKNQSCYLPVLALACS